MELSKPKKLLLVKNSGDFSLAVSKNSDEIILSSELSLFNDSSVKQKFHTIVSIPNNHIVEVNEDCTYNMEKI